jgi:predicted DNA-binding transcriptional regulator AlpA
VSNFLTSQQAAERIGVSKSTLLRRLRQNKPVPPVIKIDERTLRWRASDIDEWLEGRRRTENDNDNDDNAQSNGDR